MHPWLLLTNSVFFVCFVVLVSVAPQERTLGVSQKVLYFHVPNAIATYVILGVGLIGLLVSFSRRLKHLGDSLVEQSLRITFLTATVSLLTGMVWAKYAWNTFFHPEPRLVSFLMMWFLLLSAHLSKDGSGSASSFHKTVLILAVLAVPLVKYSINLLPENLRLHPTVVSSGGLADPLFRAAFLSGVGFFSIFWLTVLWLQVKIDTLKRIYIYG